LSAVFAPGAAAVDETEAGIVAGRGAVLGIDIGAEGLRAADFFTAFLGAARFFAAFSADFRDDFLADFLAGLLADFLATFLATFFFAAFLAARFLVDFLAVFLAAGRRFLEAFLPDFFADFFAAFFAFFFIAMMNLLRCTLVRRLRRKPAGLPIRQNPPGYSSAHADALSPRHPQKCVCDSANPRNARNGQRTDR
jgi:hypothetical protein